MSSAECHESVSAETHGGNSSILDESASTIQVCGTIVKTFQSLEIVLYYQYYVGLYAGHQLEYVLSKYSFAALSAIAIVLQPYSPRELTKEMAMP